ncbi:aldo/keto reductase [Phenylobacterium sp.]|uniref:aldo/keto reductase n=1 Tax=Phenylobacterium sp. TaxID=1871053 RepID=UPI002BA8C326|nr:aldo/keto reductase [Phenylobacterium sp.]HVI33739.1 aldo/keto reductase [Phenylobacterium sp.]
MTPAVPLPSRTSSLGYGCGGVFGGPFLSQSIRRIREAYDNGIRHFDVAPAYGMGTAEQALGRALRDFGGVTVATKVGIAPPSRVRSSVVLTARWVGGGVRAFAPNLASRAGKAAYSQSTTRAQFSAQFVERSVTASLRELQREHVEALLLHEVELDLITDELLMALERLRSSGAIGLVGVASTFEQTARIRSVHPHEFQLWQHEWRPTDFSARSGVPTSLHSILRSAAGPLRKRLAESPTTLDRMSSACGADLANPTMFGQAMLAAAIAANPDGLVLFSSRDPLHIQSNARVLSDPSLRDVGRRLLTQLVNAGDAPGGRQDAASALHSA